MKNKFESLNFHDRQCQGAAVCENSAENLSIKHFHEGVF